MGLPGHDDVVFCEYFDEHAGQGHVEALGVEPGATEVNSRTRLPVGGGAHTSFPLVVRIDGRIWGVAESAASRELVLHSVDDSGRWARVATLLQDVRAADPALFKWQGRYWLAFTDLALGADDNLCLFHAPDLRGPWLPHANNPVRRDVRGARMAGPMFEVDGELWRPAQNCLRGYGAALTVHRITRLSPTEFDEELVRQIQPDPAGRCPDGLHTLAAWGNRTLVDGKRLGVNPYALWRKLRERLGAPVRRFSPPGTARVRRVGVYVPHLRMGGGELSMLRLAEGLAREGVMVDLFVHTLDTAGIEVPEGVHTVVLGTHGTAESIRKLAGALRDRQPQCLLSGFPHTNVAAVMAVAMSGLHCHCVVSEHAPLTRQIEGQGGWRYRLLPPLVRWAYRRAAAVVAVSSGVRDDLGELVGTALPLQVIGNPVLSDQDLSEAGVMPPDLVDDTVSDWNLAGLDEPDARRRRAAAPPCGHPWLDDDALDVVLSVSRLSVEKDVPTLLTAFARLAADRPSLRLVVAGDGDDRARLEALVAGSGLADRIDLPGAIRRPVAWMRKASVFALASQYEGFGNVLVESLAAGCPVVATDCPVGPSEILGNGRWGRLVPVGDASAMASALALTLDAQTVPPGARAHALQYTARRSAAQYRRLMDRLVQEA
jgi:glycosyltransferase involved in cell wall biosynthesis